MGANQTFEWRVSRTRCPRCTNHRTGPNVRFIHHTSIAAKSATPVLSQSVRIGAMILMPWMVPYLSA
jgi:hypothetical protein